MFRIYAPEKVPYGIERYTNEAKRLYGVMDRQLAHRPYIAGKTYSIADIAIFLGYAVGSTKALIGRITLA
jgi:GST-like protein